MGIVKNRSMRGVMDVHLIGRPTTLDRQLEPSDCHTQLRPLWSSKYSDSVLRHLESKGVVAPGGSSGGEAAAAAAGTEERKDGELSAYSLSPWRTPRSAAQLLADRRSSSGSSVAQSTSDGSWFLAQPKMWVMAIDQDGAWWPANITQSHPVKGVNLHFLSKSPSEDRWVEPSASATLLRPLPRAKPKHCTDELWDELQLRLSRQSAQSAVAAAAEERKDHTASHSTMIVKVPSPAPTPSSGDARTVIPLAAKRHATKPQPPSPPTIASSASDRKRATNSSSSISSGSPTQPAPPNTPGPENLAFSDTSTHDYHDTYQTPGKEETHPLSVSHSKRAIVEQVNALQARHDSELTQLRDELAAVRLDNSRLQAHVVRAPQPPAPGAADLLIIHTLHERYNRAVSTLESEPPAVSGELLSELRQLVDWHLEMTGRLNRLLRLREAELAAPLPLYQ